MLAALQTNQVEISKYENLIKECQILEEEAHQEGQGQSNSGEEANNDAIMADQEDGG